jgi:hypothetical protein
VSPAIATYQDKTPSLLARSLVLMGALVGASALWVALLSLTAMLLADRAVSSLRPLEKPTENTQAQTLPPHGPRPGPKPNG